MSLFEGSGVAIVTPFKADGSVDFDAYKKLIDFQIENGTDCIISCGTTGEASTLKDDEHIETIAFAVSCANKRVPVIAGTGSNDTEHGISLTKRAYKAGVDGCLVVPPYYNKTSQRGLIEYFTSMAKCVDIPIMLYNVPSRTGINIQPKTVFELCTKVDNITAIKEASSDIVQIGEIAALCEGNIAIYSGNDDQIVPILALGGKGVVSVLANVVPRQTHDLVMKFLQGDVMGSLKIQLELFDLVKALFIEVNPIPVKEALNLMGFNCGGYRSPLVPMEDKNREILIAAMKKQGLL